MRQAIERAAEERNKIPLHLKGLLPGRNEILRIRDSENGSIRLFFKNEQEYEEAYEFLREEGISVIIKR